MKALLWFKASSVLQRFALQGLYSAPPKSCVEPASSLLNLKGFIFNGIRRACFYDAHTDIVGEKVVSNHGNQAKAVSSDAQYGLEQLE